MYLYSIFMITVLHVAPPKPSLAPKEEDRHRILIKWFHMSVMRLKSTATQRFVQQLVQSTDKKGNIVFQWRHNGRDSVSNHQPHDCLLNLLFRRRSKKILKPRVTGLCAGNSRRTGEFPDQMASNAENVSIWCRHHVSYFLWGNLLVASRFSLIHWGRVTHICVVKLTIIGSDNGLSPGRRQAIIWTNARILLIRPLGTNFSEILIGIQMLSFKKMHLKMSSAKWRPFCLGLNELNGSVIWKVPSQ